MVIGAVFAARLPGGVAVIWPPRTIDDEAEVEDALTRAALAHVHGVRAVQAFLPPEEIERAEALVRGGFEHVTRVWQMAEPFAAPRQRSASRPRGDGVRHSADASRPTVVPASECVAATVAATLLRAHDDSFDCPELHRALTPDDVVNGYLAAAPDQAGWWLALADEAPCGILLMNGPEITFLGVLPTHRGKGIGRRLLEAAFDLAPSMSLIVDARNIPAFQLYRSAGFEVVGAREVFLHFPGPAAGITATKVSRS